ncbi:MAG: fimbrillin family protein [Rikenellaceae bacterium]
MKKQITLLAAAVIVFTGCNDNTTTLDGGRVALKVNGNIEVQTRASDEAWAAKDAIGIYMVDAGTVTIAEEATNRQYETATGDGAFTAEAANVIYFPVDNSKVDFYAYYPYTSALNADGAIAVNVTDQSTQATIDLMGAKLTSQDKQNPAIALGFKHLLTKLTLKISAGAGLTSADLQGMTVQITNQSCLGSYAPLTQALTLTEGSNDVTLLTSADGTSAEAVLLPNMLGNLAAAGRQLIFTLNNAKKEAFKYDIPADKAFDAGKKNTYTVTLNRTGISVTSTITNWGSSADITVSAE